MKVTRTSCLAIMLSLWLHSTTAQDLIIVPRTRPNMGSCSRLTFSDVKNILITAAKQEGYRFDILYEYRPLCSVSGIYRDTYSQHSVLVRVFCVNCEGQEYTVQVFQLTFICHRSTNSYWRPNVTHPWGPVLYFHNTGIFHPPEYNPKCGRCSSRFRQLSPQFCRGMY